MYTDEQILSMSKITPQIAGEYLGIPPTAVISQLRDDATNGSHLLPIGFASRSYNDKTWHYIIVPRKLVAYKNGTGREDIERLLSEVRCSLDQVIDYLRTTLV